MVQGFLSLAKLHNVPIKPPAPKPAQDMADRLSSASRKSRKKKKQPWMKGLRVVSAASGMLGGGGASFLFRDKQDAQTWVNVLRHGFYIDDPPGTPSSRGGDASAGGAPPSLLNPSAMMRRSLGSVPPMLRRSGSGSRRLTSSPGGDTQRRALRIDCNKADSDNVGEWLDESLRARHRSSCFFTITAPDQAVR